MFCVRRASVLIEDDQGFRRVIEFQFDYVGGGAVERPFPPVVESDIVRGPDESFGFDPEAGVRGEDADFPSLSDVQFATAGDGEDCRVVRDDIHAYPLVREIEGGFVFHEKGDVAYRVGLGFPGRSDDVDGVRVGPGVKNVSEGFCEVVGVLVADSYHGPLLVAGAVAITGVTVFTRAIAFTGASDFTVAVAITRATTIASTSIVCRLFRRG